MHMIGHDHPRTQFIETPFALPDVQRLDDETRDVGISQPNRTGSGTIQAPVMGHKGVARRHSIKGQTCAW